VQLIGEVAERHRPVALRVLGDQRIGEPGSSNSTRLIVSDSASSTAFAS
jgi:hypothetical protein